MIFVVLQYDLILIVDSVQARLASHKGMISLREPHKGVISRKGTMLQSATGEELRPFFGSPSGAG